MVVQRPRHRPILSIDSALSSIATGQTRTTTGAGQAKPPPARSFQKVRGSIQYPPLTGIPPELHRKRYEPIQEGTDDSSGSDYSATSDEPPPIPPFIPFPASTGSSISDSGPLLTRTYAGGSAMTLSLDRMIHYQAAPAAVSAWTYHQYQHRRTADSNNVEEKKEGGGGCSPRIVATSYGENDPIWQSTEVASVPRLLLMFSLDLTPQLRDEALGIRENFELVSITLDFWSAAPPQGLQGAYTRTPIGRRKSVISCDMPLVRGFSGTDLASTGFLQSFGPSLYAGLHAPGPDETPVVLGEAHEHYIYKSFERRLARLQRPTILGSDRLAARGSGDSGATAPSTPATPALDAGHPSPLTPSFEVPAYGTSSIRIMVKRDTLQEASWAAKSIPFLVLLEDPPSTASIEAKVKLDVSTVRKNLPGVLRRDSRKMDTWMAGMDRMPLQSPAATYAAAQRKAMTLEEPDEDEQLIKIYPRRDAVSVVSCGVGSVKDTLFANAMKRKGNGASSKTYSPPAPPVPKKDALLVSSGMTPSVRRRPDFRATHSRSAMITPGQYQRSDSVSSSEYSASTTSVSGTSSGSRLQRSVTSRSSPDHDVDQLFDIVLANWATAKMESSDASSDEEGFAITAPQGPTTPLKYGQFARRQPRG